MENAFVRTPSNVILDLIHYFADMHQTIKFVGEFSPTIYKIDCIVWLFTLDQSENSFCEIFALMIIIYHYDEIGNVCDGNGAGDAEVEANERTSTVLHRFGLT